MKTKKKKTAKRGAVVKPAADPLLMSDDDAVGRLRTMAGVLGGGAWKTISWTFSAMEVAETELERVYGPTARQPRNVFSLLVPNKLLTGLSLDVYRAHVKELLMRLKVATSGIENDIDLLKRMSVSTYAECLSALCTTSLKFPLTHSYVKMAEVCYAEVFPELPIDWTAVKVKLNAFEQQQFDDFRLTLGRTITRGTE